MTILLTSVRDIEEPKKVNIISPGPDEEGDITYLLTP